MTTANASAQIELAREVSKYYADPLGFVYFAWRWGAPGALQDEAGPDANQIEFLKALGEEVKARKFDGSNPVLPIQMAESSGHGTGKSAMGAWLGWWILSTRPMSIGTVTAGTYTQLEEKTWAAMMHWGKMCITARWFDIQASGIYHRKYPEAWKVSPQTCKEQNAQSFAGQHARKSTSWYLMDEASEVPNKIFETSYGGMTDGEPMIFAWGQLVRNTGEFYEICCGAKNVRWNHRRVDSRTSRFTNKELLAQWIADYGIDSDFCKSRILGYPPSASELQYIDKKRVDEAAARKIAVPPGEPLLAGFDVSGGGRAWNVIRFRRGLDGNPEGMAPWRLPGEKDPNRDERVAKCHELLTDRRPGKWVAALFIDSAFGAAIAERLRGLGHTNVYEVNAGSASPDSHCLNMRAYLWMKSKEHMLLGTIADDEQLKSQLCLPGYHINSSRKLVIESKESIQKRGEKSPDDADAFNLTFARNMAPVLPVEELTAEEQDAWRRMQRAESAQ